MSPKLENLRAYFAELIFYCFQDNTEWSLKIRATHFYVKIGILVLAFFSKLPFSLVLNPLILTAAKSSLTTLAKSSW